MIKGLIHPLTCLLWSLSWVAYLLGAFTDWLMPPCPGLPDCRLKDMHVHTRKEQIRHLGPYGYRPPVTYSTALALEEYRQRGGRADVLQ